MEIAYQETEDIVFVITDSGDNPPRHDLHRKVTVTGVPKSDRFPRKAARMAVKSLGVKGSPFVWRIDAETGELDTSQACRIWEKRAALWKWRDGVWAKQRPE